MLQKRKDLKSSKDLQSSKDTQSTKAIEASGHSNQTAQATPEGGERAKRKHMGTPGSSESPRQAVICGSCWSRRNQE